MVGLEKTVSNHVHDVDPAIENQSQAERVSMTSTVTGEGGIKGRNHGTQDSRVVPHRGTNWAALWLTTQIERDAVLSKSYGRG